MQKINLDPGKILITKTVNKMSSHIFKIFYRMNSIMKISYSKLSFKKEEKLL